MFLLSVHDLSSQVDLCKLLPLDSCEQHLEKRMQQCQSWWLFIDSWPRAAVRTKGSDDAPAGASGISKPHISSAHRERRRAWCVCRLAVCDVHIWDSSAAWDQARLLKKKWLFLCCEEVVKLTVRKGEAWSYVIFRDSRMKTTKQKDNEGRETQPSHTHCPHAS